MRPGRSGRKELWGTEVLLDSNVFLEAELAEEHGEACKQLLERLRDGGVKAAITDFHVDSVVVHACTAGSREKPVNFGTL